MFPESDLNGQAGMLDEMTNPPTPTVPTDRELFDMANAINEGNRDAWRALFEVRDRTLKAMSAKHIGPVITDGFGNTWAKTCPECGRETMEVVRPGKVQCGRCG